MARHPNSLLAAIGRATVLLALIGCTRFEAPPLPTTTHTTSETSITVTTIDTLPTSIIVETPATEAEGSPLATTPTMPLIAPTATHLASFEPLELVSRADDNSPGNSYSLNPSISADGQWVAFESLANNLVPNDTNACWSRIAGQVTEGHCTDIFVRDRLQGNNIVRVSVSTAGSQANNESLNPVISADGQWVVFYSRADNLVPEYNEICVQRAWPDNCTGVFLHHQPTRQTRLVVVISDNGGLGPSADLSISADGRWVAFHAFEPGLGGIPNEQGNVFMWDRESSEIVPVSINATGQAGNGSSYAPDLSADGRTVVFESFASNLVPDDTNDMSDIFVYDIETRAIERVSLASDGTQANDESALPFISADGRWVVFSSRASNLVTDDTHECNDVRTGLRHCFDVFVHDRQTGQTERVSVASDGTESNDESSARGISADGRWVLFDSLATNLAPDTPENTTGIFLHDRQTGQTQSVITTGAFAPTISTDGQWLAFGSTEALVPHDSQQCPALGGQEETNCWDVYVKRLYVTPSE